MYPKKTFYLILETEALCSTYLVFMEASTSEALFPVAQRMKTWPKRASYVRLHAASSSITSSVVPSMIELCSAVLNVAKAPYFSRSDARSPSFG